MSGPGPPAHAVRALFHSTAMVADYDLTVARLAALFGLRVLEYGQDASPAVGRRGGMCWIGDGSIEIGQPIVAGAPPDRFVQRTGGGMHSVAVWVENFAATVAHLEAHGVRVPVRVERGFGFSSPSTTGGLQFEWSDFTVDEDPRVGAPLPALRGEPLVAVTHQAFVGAMVDDPLGVAVRLAADLGLAVVSRAGDGALAPGGPGEPHAVVSVGDCVLALFPHRPLDAERLWGRPRERPGVSLLGLRVDDLARAAATLRAAGVGIVRQEPDLVVLEPAATGGVEVALVDRLLPGDPRG